MSYFRHEVVVITRDWATSIATRKQVGDSNLGWAVLWGTVPLGFAGLLFHNIVEQELRTPLVIAATTIGFGLLLWFGDVAGKRRRNEHTIHWKDILIIGLAQAIALIPGTSRSGITITAGLILGLTREAAARFSFLLSIPAILLAGGYQSLQLYQSPGLVDWGVMSVGILASGVMAYTCIHLFLKMLEHMGMWPFVLYRLVLGGVLIYMFV
jgi:undecaprenyl-diphosphatase